MISLASLNLSANTFARFRRILLPIWGKREIRDIKSVLKNPINSAQCIVDSLTVLNSYVSIKMVKSANKMLYQLVAVIDADFGVTYTPGD